MRGRWRRWADSERWGFPVPDLAIAGLVCLVAVVSAVTGNPDEGPLWVTVPVAIGMSLALAWRRRSAVVMVVVIVTASMAQTLLAQPPGSLWSLVVSAIAVYSAAAYRAEASAALLGGAIVIALLVEERIANGVDFLFIVLLFSSVWLLGRASRLWRNRVSTAEARQRDAARLAVAEERLRLARELHDVVGHSLSVIAVQSDAAAAALDRDPARAVQPVQTIRTVARDALDEIREMLDLLRSDASAVPGVQAPGISAIDRLVSATRAGGVPLEVRVRMTDAPLPPDVDLAAYRVVQEALTNVMRHAPGAVAKLEIVQEPEQLSIVVENGPAGTPDRAAGAGYGLLGLRERVRLLAGTVQAAPVPGGGFRVAVQLPTGRAVGRTSVRSER